MPTPSKGEKQSDFISRAVRQIMGEGKDQKAALGEAYGIWRQHHGGTAKLFCEVLKQPNVQDVHGQTSLARRRKQRQMAIMNATKHPPQQNGGGDQDIGTEKIDWGRSLTITKADPERQMVFGWASVVARDGQYIIDKQDDIIPVEELENAVFDYMLHSRDHGVMHEYKGTGRLVQSFLTTPDMLKAFGLTQERDQIGWIVGYKIEDPALWEAHKRGLLPEFSIGGSSVPIEQSDNGSPLNLAVGKAKGKRVSRSPFR